MNIFDTMLYKEYFEMIATDRKSRITKIKAIIN